MVPELQPYLESVVKLVQSIYDDSILANMMSNGNATKIPRLTLNKNFDRAEFQELWKRINHKYAYKISVDTENLIKDAIRAIDRNLFVNVLSYTVASGEQNAKLDADTVARGDSFTNQKATTEKLKTSGVTSLKYDIIGQIAKRSKLTRKTIARILQGIGYDKFLMYHQNPEQFIRKVSELIIEEKAKMVIDHITYEVIDGEYDSDIFTSESNINLEKAFKVEKNINDYVVWDSTTEKNFAEELEAHSEVAVYAKLPRSFQIPTPVPVHPTPPPTPTTKFHPAYLLFPAAYSPKNCKFNKKTAVSRQKEESAVTFLDLYFNHQTGTVRGSLRKF